MNVAILPPTCPTTDGDFPRLDIYPLARPRNAKHRAVWVVAKALEHLPGDPISYGLLVYKVATIYRLGVDAAQVAVDLALLTPAFEVENRDAA